MKKIILASVAALILSSPAVAADFDGPRLGAAIGLADRDFGGDDAFTYGINAGYDANLGSAVVGGTVEYQESGADGFGRDLSVVGRVGTQISNNALFYGLAGYTNFNVEGTDADLDGYRLGLGVEVATDSKVYGQVEYRYSNYEYDVEGHQFVFGLGYRF